MAGRKRKPTGTVTPRGGRPVPPPDLGEAECEAFERIVDDLVSAGLASPEHRFAIGLAARRMVEVAELDEKIREHGIIYETISTKGLPVLKGNPATAARSDALRQLQSLLENLGLAPTSVAKATPPKKPEAANPYARFASGKGAAKKG